MKYAIGAVALAPACCLVLALSFYIVTGHDPLEGGEGMRWVCLICLSVPGVFGAFAFSVLSGGGR